MIRDVLRFALLGTLLVLLAGDGAPWRAVAVDRPPPSDEELLFRAAVARGWHESDPVVRARLVRNLRFAGADPARDESELVAEALALAMHETDLVVRRRLAQRIELAIAAAVRAEEPDEAALESWLAAHRERFTEPGRTRLSQVPFRDPHRARVAARRAAFAPGDADAPLRGDALPFPRELPWLSAAELAARFGPSFARAVATLPEGRWAGPVASAYGDHLVFVHGRRPPRVSPLARVRGEVREALLAERTARAREEALARLRSRAAAGPGQAP